MHCVLGILCSSNVREIVCSKVDVSNSSEVEKATEQVVEQLGGVDILINNAGKIISSLDFLIIIFLFLNIAFLLRWCDLIDILNYRAGQVIIVNCSPFPYFKSDSHILWIILYVRQIVVEFIFGLNKFHHARKLQK